MLIIAELPDIIQIINTYGNITIVAKLAKQSGINLARMCHKCGEFFNESDSIDEYICKDDDGEVSMYFHHSCKPDDDDFIGFESNAFVRTCKLKDIEIPFMKDRHIESPAKKRGRVRGQQSGIKIEILKCLSENNDLLSAKEIADKIGKSEKTVQDSLWYMAKTEQIKADKSQRPYRYKLLPCKD